MAKRRRPPSTQSVVNKILRRIAHRDTKAVSDLRVLLSDRGGVVRGLVLKTRIGKQLLHALTVCPDDKKVIALAIADYYAGRTAEISRVYRPPVRVKRERSPPAPAPEPNRTRKRGPQYPKFSGVTCKHCDMPAIPGDDICYQHQSE